jgi:hypothetical protein
VDSDEVIPVETADAQKDCARALVSTAHACIASSDAWRCEATSAARSSSIHICNEVAGKCLALHSLLVRPREADIDLVLALEQCGASCRRAEAVCFDLADSHWLCGAAAASCRRCAERCENLAELIASSIVARDPA